MYCEYTYVARKKKSVEQFNSISFSNGRKSGIKLEKNPRTPPNTDH